MPLRELLRARRSLLLIGCKIAEVTLIYTFLVFSVSMPYRNWVSAGHALHALLYGAGVLMFTIPLFGMLGDRIGARRVCGWGGMLLGLMAIPIFLAVGSGSLVAYSLAVFVAMAFNYAIMIAPQSSLYNASSRGTALFQLSIGLFSAAIGGNALISATLVQKFGSILPWASTWRSSASSRAPRRFS